MLREERLTGAGLHALVEDLRKRDPALVASIEKEFGERVGLPGAALEGLDPVAGALYESVSDSPLPGIDAALESIILSKGRPVLAVVNDEVDTKVIDDDAADEIRKRLANAKGHLDLAIRAVGRIEVQNNPTYEWCGTGWVIDDGIIVTNRHVAEVFAMRSGNDFVFRPGLFPGAMQSALIDFLEEIGNSASREVPLSEILWIAPDQGPDIAFLKLGYRIGPQKIRLATATPAPNTDVAVIGYPAKDSRIPDAALMDRIYGAVYDHKRLAPGKIMGRMGQFLLHDCATLGGNSGSVVLDLNDGHAVGLHFSGAFKQANYAVPADVVAGYLVALSRPGADPARNPVTVEATPVAVAPASAAGAGLLPLTITVTIASGAPPGIAIAGSVQAGTKEVANTSPDPRGSFA